MVSNDELLMIVNVCDYTRERGACKPIAKVSVDTKTPTHLFAFTFNSTLAEILLSNSVYLPKPVYYG